MTDRAALIALRDAVVAGEFERERSLTEAGRWRFNAFMDLAEPAFDSLPSALMRSRQNAPLSWEAYKGSMNAATSLANVQVMAMHWNSTVDEAGLRFFWFETPGRGFATEPIHNKIDARALLIAALNAMIAKEQE